MRIVLLLPIIPLIVATKCMAFDAWSFASGETKSAIERNATARGETVQQVEALTVINRVRPDTGAYESFHLNFCDGRLFAVTKIESFTPATFINVLSGLMEQHGTPAISAREQTVHSFTDITSKEVQYTWRSPDDRIQLTTNIATATAPSLKLEPGMTVTHSDSTICDSTSSTNEPDTAVK
ncbi:hypothetical protein G3N95_09935 [Paraburkholderia sp. Tr-20389]|uniref:hypothetical protein n=1 Tax=Paraburkholderia sp. Tr-20389 TaxID=2703903 RepID=UPI00197ED7EC|nr:hypothetical protein [Paraburkholderia sp. Tr-20389]MBN3753264.1 hypothetical protein [Paraburkholderia sp. Tr-20389]